MANTVPVNTNCYVLRSCTTGDDTVLTTSASASPLLAAYAASGQHIKISNTGYTNICFSVELIESGCLDCSNSVTITPILPNPVCNCNVVYNYYVLTPCDPSLPSFYTAQNLYPYDGTTITFFGQGGVCYTVTGDFNIPQGATLIGVQCPETCQCVIPDCGCPDGYTLNPETGLCDGFIETTPTFIPNEITVIKSSPGSSPFPLTPPFTLCSSNWGSGGAFFYDNIDSLPKPLTPVLTSFNPPLLDGLGNPCIHVVNANSFWAPSVTSVPPCRNFRLDVAGVWGSGFILGEPQGVMGFTFCFDFPETKEYYIGLSGDDYCNLAVDGVLIMDHSMHGYCFQNWKVLPMTFTAGTHLIELTTADTGNGISGVGLEIYDVPSYAILQACTSANGTPGPTDLNQYILFSTLEKLTPPNQVWDTGTNYGYSCPDGSVFSNCGIPLCLQTTSIPQLPCFTFKITFCDGVNLDPIITNTDLSQYLGAVYTICYDDDGTQICGCGSVSRIDSQVAPDFTGTFSTIFYDCCEKCTQVCYLLEDCQGAVDPIITCTDLSNYVNQIVKLSNCGDICWKVSESNTCDDSILLGTVIENFIPTVIEGKACVYKTNISPEFVTFSSLQIMINNTEYVIDFTTFIQLFTDLNNLNLGTFSLSGDYLAVTGNENYGLMCLVRPPKPKICIEPVCSTYTKYCTYKELRITDNLIPFFTFTIIINGTTYTGNIPSRSITDFFTYLNSLNLGIFVRVPSAPIFLIVRVYGNETYGNMQFGGIILDPTCIENENLDFTQACTDCLPPLPPEPVLDLHLRRIKPGYFSPNSCITTEYMDRINCNFAKQVYDAMLIKRYGITVCCDHDVDAWDIKKQGLDFELLTDPDLCKSTLCTCPAPCLIGAFLTVNPTCIKPNLISAYFNPCYPPVITSVTIELNPPPLPADCWTIAGLGGFTIVTYETDQGIPVSVQGGFDILQICSSIIPTTSGKIPPTIVGPCDNSCGIPPDPIEGCKCFRVVVSTDDANIAEVTIEYADCNEVYTSVVQTSAIADLYICSSITPIVLSGTSNASVAMIANNPIDCINDPGSCGPPL